MKSDLAQHLLWAVVSWTLLLMSPLACQASWLILVPSSFGQSRILTISGHDRRYYSIERDQPLSVQAKGPTQIRILTRLEFESQPSEAVDYTIEYTMDDQATDHVDFSSRPIEAARDPNNPKVLLGYLRDYCIDVPRGVHSYTFQVTDGVDRVWVRVQEQQSTYMENLRRIAFQPHHFTKAADLEVKEKITTYYRIGNDNELQLDVIGPTNVKILARLEYDQTMHGAQKYRFQILEGDKVVETYSLSTELSDVAKYIGATSTLLSRGETVYLDVPKGPHSYRVVLLDENRTALIKFLIPVKDLGNES
jgi:hypothetical protein